MAKYKIPSKFEITNYKEIVTDRLKKLELKVKLESNKLVIVSGASKGLGLELVTKLLESGWNVEDLVEKNNHINLLNKKFGNKFIFKN